MRRMLVLAAGAAMALSLSMGHADPTNACLATGDIGGFSTPGPLTCSYTAASASGQIIQATPNQVHVTVTYEGETTEVYVQELLTLPGQETFATPVGSTVTVTVGPDAPPGSPQGGAIGLVIVGDAE